MLLLSLNKAAVRVTQGHGAEACFYHCFVSFHGQKCDFCGACAQLSSVQMWQRWLAVYPDVAEASGVLLGHIQGKQ